jgi:hypothetical protein
MFAVVVTLLLFFHCYRELFYLAPLFPREPGKLSRYSDGLRAERPEFDSQHRQEIIPYSTASRPALERTKPPAQWVPGLFPKG